MYWIVGAVALLPYGPVLVKVAPVAVRKVRQRVERWGRRLRHGATLAKVRGTVRPIQLVRSPMTGLECTFSVMVFSTHYYRGRGIGRTLHVFHGKDFFVDGAAGPTLVRT